MSDHIRNLVMITPPSEEPVSLATAKNHLRVTITNDDALISALITAARMLVEKECRRSLVQRTYELRLDRFPWSASRMFPNLNQQCMPIGTWGIIEIPKPPLINVISITYQDANGIVQTLDPSQYQVDTGGVLAGTVCPTYGVFWPTARVNIDSIKIQFNAGYGAASAVPATATQAILLAIGNWYRNREDTTPENLKELPRGSRALISTLKWGSYR